CSGRVASAAGSAVQRMPARCRCRRRGTRACTGRVPWSTAPGLRRWRARSPSSASSGTRAPFPWRRGSDTRRGESFRSARRPLFSSSLQHAALDLVALERLEQRLEISFTETLVTLALDELEENRAQELLRKDLQQQPLVPPGGGAVEQDAACSQLLLVFAVAG